MKYGIKIEGEKIISITKFADDIIPSLFIELTEQQYFDLDNKVRTLQFSKYVNNDIVVDEQAEIEFINKKNLNIRFKKQKEIQELQQKIAMLTLLEENNCKTYYESILSQKVLDYKAEYTTQFNCNNT